MKKKPKKGLKLVEKAEEPKKESDSLSEIHADFMKRYLSPTGNAIHSVIQYSIEQLQSDQQRLFFSAAMREAMKHVAQTMKKNIIRELSKDADAKTRKSVRDSLQSLERQAIEFVGKIIQMVPREDAPKKTKEETNS